MDEQKEESQFTEEDIMKIMEDSVDAVIGLKNFIRTKTEDWISEIIELCLKELVDLQKPYKYIVKCIILQNTGAALHVGSSCYWNNDTDGSYTYRWKNDTMHCVVTIFGLAT